MNTFNFKSLDIVEGMRIFLGNFLMKGESQQIFRILENFNDIFFD